MSIQQEIDSAIIPFFKPLFCQLENESHQHSGGVGGESHWNLFLVSEKFEGVSKVKRHQLVYQVLGPIMNKIHALTLKTLDPKEWEKLGKPQTHLSPPCHGGGKPKG